jgi:heptosyltransferase-1
LLSTSSQPGRILIVRVGAMGDVIHALPAVVALRRAFPSAQIGWVIEERWSQLLCVRDARNGNHCAGGLSPRKPLVEVVHAVNTLAWRKAMLSGETWKEIFAATGLLRAQKYEILFDFQGAMKSALIGRLSGAPVRIGFRQSRERAASAFYSRQVSATQAHVVENGIELLAPLIEIDVPAMACADIREYLPHDEAAERWCDQQLLQKGLTQFAMLNPGAGWGAKCWPVERYGQLARGLAEKGLRCVVNYGPGEDELARAVEAASGGTAYPLLCSIGELIALTRRAQLFIGGDTGPLHLAAALRIPVVGIYGPTNPARNGPYATRNIVLRSPESETSHARRQETETGMLGITVADVLSAAEQVLAEVGA